MKKLYLGTGRTVITPEVGGRLYGYNPNIYSTSVADDLTATAFYFKQGDTQALMVSATVCSVSKKVVTRIFSQVEEKYGIPQQNCMLCATHTHSGPCLSSSEGWGDLDCAYCDRIFVPGVLKAIEEAVQNPQAVQMGTASGTSMIGINRRELTAENKIVLGQNPWGCFNPKMTVLTFRNEAGQNVANMVHYGLHGTSAGLNHEVTRDWSGVMIDTLERQSGAITAFFNGPEGDVGPRLSNGKTTGSHDMTYVYELGAVAAQDAVRIYNDIFNYVDVELRVSIKELTLPRKNRLSVEEATALRDQYKDHTVNLGRKMFVYANEVLASYKSEYQEVKTSTEQQTLIGLGNMVFAAFEYELFSEIGMRIDQCFKTASVLSLSNTNGTKGYLITEDAICRGGYEVNYFLYSGIQPLAANADFHLMKETVTHINEMIGEKERSE